MTLTSISKRCSLLSVLALLAACGKEPAAPQAAAVPSAAAALQPLATTRQVMLGLVIPASDVLFQVGDKTPADQAGWDRVEANAVMLAEAGAMLTVAPRKVDDQDWLRFTTLLIDAAKKAADSARMKDADKVLDDGNALYEVCDTCHKKYMAAVAGQPAPPGEATAP